MKKVEAVGHISDGHSLWTIECAKEICEALGVQFSNKLITHYGNQAEANPDNNPKGMWLEKDEPTDGVEALRLSYYCADQLGIDTSNSFSGRGFQAQWLARQIEKQILEKTSKENYYNEKCSDVATKILNDVLA